MDLHLSEQIYAFVLGMFLSDAGRDIFKFHRSLTVGGEIRLVCHAEGIPAYRYGRKARGLYVLGGLTLSLILTILAVLNDMAILTLGALVVWLVVFGSILVGGWHLD